MKKLNQFLNIVMGCSVGTLIGHSWFMYIDYTKNPELYAMQSAPWYTSILLYGGVTLFVVAISMIAKLFIWKKLK